MSYLTFIYRKISTLLLILILLFTVGCEETTKEEEINPANSKVKSDQAYQMVENEMFNMINGNNQTLTDFDQYKFESALTLYNEALKLDPNNTDARFGAAITEILSAYANPEINKLIKEIDSSDLNSPIKKGLFLPLLRRGTAAFSVSLNGAGENLIYSFRKALGDPPLISRIQSVLENHFLPKLNSAISHLALIDDNESFRFIISGKMQGDPTLSAISLYCTEVSLLEAALNGLKFGLETFFMYKFELPDYTQASLLSALNKNSTNFFYLKTDGQARALAAKATFTRMVQKLKNAADYLGRVSGNKQDAAIKLGNDGISQSDLDTVKKYLNKMETALSSTIQVEIKNGDSDGNDYTININIGNFLSNPPQNPKTELLPSYSVEPSGSDGVHLKFDAATYNDFVFPDPTIRGLLPGMTNETLKRLLYIDEEFAFRLTGWINIRGFYDYYSYATSLKVKIYTAVNSYMSTVNEWMGYEIFVRDAGTTPVEITRIELIDGLNVYELKNYVQNAPVLSIVSKKEVWSEIYFVPPPHDLNATVLQNLPRVRLSWLVNGLSYGNPWAYKVQRKENSGNFYDIYPSYFSGFTVDDYSIITGTQYTYRIRTTTPEENYNYYYNQYIFGTLNPIYSNEVIITP